MTTSPIPRAQLHDSFLIRGEQLKLITGCGAIDHLPGLVTTQDPDKIVLVFDRSIPNQFLAACKRVLAGWPVQVIPLKHPGESMKSMQALEHLLDTIEPHATKDTVLIAVGGGATTNAAGMAAALLFRGIRLIHVPTTTMAQADAAIGLKQALNSAVSKNIYGLYHQPNAVVNDTSPIEGLSDWQVREGTAEIAKLAIAAGGDLMNRIKAIAPGNSQSFLRKNALPSLVHSAAALKLSGLETDPCETGTMRLLELGHVVAHAVESASNYRISHGSAVALGIMVELRFAMMSYANVDPQLPDICRSILQDRLGFPRKPSVLPHPSAVASALRRSNKRTSGGLLMTLPLSVGETTIREVPEVDGIAAAYAVETDAESSV